MSRNEATDSINLLLQLGKIGTRVQILKENGDLSADQLFFRSLSERKLTWSNNRKSITISPYVLILPGKITGLLSIAPSVSRYPDALCLGIVSKHHVLELIFQNSRDRSIWSEGLGLLVSAPIHIVNVKPPSPSSSSKYYLDPDIIENTDTATCWNGNDIIQWHEITGDEKEKIERLYPFLLDSYRGCIFHQFHGEKLKLPTQVILRLNGYGDRLQCVDMNYEVVMEMPFDHNTQIIDPQQAKQQHFRYAPKSMHCFSIIHQQQNLHIACNDRQQYELWRYGLQYLSQQRHHHIRMRVRRAILAGDLVLDANKKLSESPSRSKQSKNNSHPHHVKEESLSKSSSFWGSIFG